MKIYQITYSGVSTRFQNLKYNVVANSEREAVIKFYSNIFDCNYFPQDDGSILDCDGYEVATADDNYIYHDGGYFSAEIVEN